MNGMLNHCCRRAYGILVLWVVVTAIFPNEAVAAFDTPCGPSTHRGRVKRIDIAEISVDALSGLQVGRVRRHSEVTFTADGRFATFTRFQTDTLQESQHQMFPTATSEYDDRGLLSREVYVVPGRSHKRVTTCQYDGQLRVVKETTTTTNPETVRTLDFEYGEGWRRQHFKTSAASILVVQVLDKHDNLISEEERDILIGTVRKRVEFTRTGDKVESCAIAETGVRFCQTTVRDTHGNVIEARSGEGYRRERYEYDRAGNWVSKTTTGNGALAESATNVTIRRTITYW